MQINTLEIIKRAEEIVQECNSRDPHRIAQILGVQILERDFVRQLGVYKPVLDIPFIFIKGDLDPVKKRVVLLHELGHHVLHTKQAKEDACFTEMRLFSLDNDRMECEANLFAAQISLPDDEFLEMLYEGYSAEQVAQASGTDVNLVALKVEILNAQGYKFIRQEFSGSFLRN